MRSPLSRVRLRLSLALVLALALVALLASWKSLVVWPAERLVRSDAPSLDAPFIILLMGDRSTIRAEKALELLQRNDEARLLMAREEPEGFVAAGLAKSGIDLHVEYLVARGVARNRLVVIDDCATTSTVDEARCFLDFLERANRPQSVPVITSWYHTRRAGWLFESAWQPDGPRVEMVAATSPRSNPSVWLTEEQAGLAVLTEYVKTAYWLLKSSEERSGTPD